MKIIKNILDLNKAIKDFKNFGFVPTMGGIHKGHISLIKNSQKICKKTIVSIFVNPTQFNNKDDYKKYPKNLNKDIKILTNFLSEQGKILPRRVTGLTSKEQKKVAKLIKTARIAALLPFVIGKG